MRFWLILGALVLAVTPGCASDRLAAGANAIGASYHLNAVAFGRPDRAILQSSGITPSTSAGFGWALNDRLAPAVDAYDAPLTVRRFAGAPQTMDNLVSARALIAYRIR